MNKQNELSPDATDVLAAAQKLSSQDCLELTSTMLSSLAHEMEPKDRLGLASALVIEAVKKMKEDSFNKLRGRRDVIDRLEELESHYGPRKVGLNTYIDKDSITLRGKKVDIILVAKDAWDKWRPPTIWGWILEAKALGDGYRLATREENICYVEKVLDREIKIAALNDQIEELGGGYSSRHDVLRSGSCKMSNIHSIHHKSRAVFPLYCYGKLGVLDIDGTVRLQMSSRKEGSISQSNECPLDRRIEVLACLIVKTQPKQEE